MESLKKIRCVITDLDGVLTDGHLYMDSQGEEIKTFHVHDGVGIKLLLTAGIKVGLITTSTSVIIDKRMKQLGITDYFCGQKNKLKAFNDLLERFDVTANEVLMIGDDLPDLDLLMRSGFSATVADAVFEVRECADFVSSKPGGRGAVREICDLLLDSLELKEKAVAEYLNE